MSSHVLAYITFYLQERFEPEGIRFKTMKSMDKAARMAMMPDYEMFCVDLREGVVGMFKSNCCNE